MPRFTPKTQEQINSQAIAKLVARTALSDVGDPGVLIHVAGMTSRISAQEYYEMSLLLLLFSIDNATGDDLDERAAEIQPGVIQRIQAAKAVGTVVFSRQGTTGTVTIPVGTRIKTSDGKVYSTTSVGSITPTSPEQISGHGVGRDSNETGVIAIVAGLDGNVATGTIIKFDSKPAGVDEVTNPSGLTQGRDKESDDSFRTRIKAFVAGLARCNIGAIESNLVGQQDPDTGATILTSKVFEDQVNLGNFTVYIDDGTGTAESVDAAHTLLAGTYTWNGTTTVTTGDTSDIAAGDFIKLGTTGLMFEIVSIVPSTSCTIDNPSAETIPTGTGAGYKSADVITEGLAGPPPDSAVGGETLLFTDNKPIKATEPFRLYSSTRGLLVENTDYQFNQASGQIDFLIALTAGEVIAADYVYYVGLIAYAQKIVDGDPNDRTAFPGFRAAGTKAVVQTPQILIQTVIASLTILDGFDQQETRASVAQSIKEYINDLGISGDVIRSEIIGRAMAVDGVFNITVTTPANDVIILDDQLARTTDANVTVI